MKSVNHTAGHNKILVCFIKRVISAVISILSLFGKLVWSGPSSAFEKWSSHKMVRGIGTSGREHVFEKLFVGMLFNFCVFVL